MGKRIWTRCDELNRPFFLTVDDECYYHEEYFKGSFDSSTGNQLIYNFKIGIEFKGQKRWYYKTQAIETFVNIILQTGFGSDCALIAAPTSKLRTSLLFDSRLDDVLKTVHNRNPKIPVFYSFSAQRDEIPVHNDTHQSRHPSILIQNMTFQPFRGDFIPQTVFIIDDVITTGGHFIAAKNLLLQYHPNIQVCGLFLAKRIFEFAPD